MTDEETLNKLEKWVNPKKGSSEKGWIEHQRIKHGEESKDERPKQKPSLRPKPRPRTTGGGIEKSLPIGDRD